MEKMQQNFDTKVAKDMADIREATEHLADSTRDRDRIETLESSEQAKQSQIEKLSQRLVALEGRIAAQSNSLNEVEDKIAAQSISLAEKDKELATKDRQIQTLTEQCESLRQKMLKRPATPLSSFQNRIPPAAIEASEDNIMNDNGASEDNLMNENEASEENPVNEIEASEDNPTNENKAPEKSAHQSASNLSAPATPSSETSSSPQEIVERDLQKLGLRLAFVTVNSAGRLCSRLCQDGELKGVMLDQLASCYTKLGDDYISHLEESHKCISCSITNSAPHWTVQGAELYTCRACYNAHRACIKRNGDRLQMMLLPDDASRVEDDIVSDYVNLTNGHSRSLKDVWQKERAPAFSTRS